jgi:hypothetical protein
VENGGHSLVSQLTRAKLDGVDAALRRDLVDV